MGDNNFYNAMLTSFYVQIENKSQQRMYKISEHLKESLDEQIEKNSSFSNDYENILHKYQMEMYNELIERSNKKKIVQFIVMWIQKYPKGLKDDCMDIFKTTFGERENDVKLASGIFDSVLRKYYSQVK